MESADDFKKRLRSEEELPADLNWEQMEEGIFAKMAEIPPKSASRKYGYWWWTGLAILGILLLATIIIGFYQWNQAQEIKLSNLQIAVAKQQEQTIPMDSSKATLEKEKKASQEITETTSNFQKNSQNPSTDLQPKITDTDVNITIKNSMVNVSNSEQERSQKQISNKDILEKIHTKKSNNQLYDDEKIRSSSFTPQDYLAAEIELLPTTTSAETSLLQLNENNSVAVDNSASTTTNFPVKNELASVDRSPLTDASAAPNELDLLVSTIPFLTYSREEKPLSRWLNVAEKALSPAIKKRFALALTGGANYWFAQRGTDSVSLERDAYETALLGYQGGLQFDYHIHKNWLLRAGVQHQQLHSVFDFTEVTTFQRLKENVIVGIQVAAFTQDSLTIRGDTLINVLSERRVRHYNSSQKWSIPVGINYLSRHSNLEYQFGIGASFTLQSTTVGRTVANGLIIDYNKNQPLYRSNLEVALQTALGANYYFYQDYFIGVEITARKYLTDWNINIEQTQHPILVSGQARIGMRF